MYTCYNLWLFNYMNVFQFETLQIILKKNRKHKVIKKKPKTKAWVEMGNLPPP